MSDDILSQVITKIQNSTFNFYAIQLDETTDIANLAQLCVYVRYINENHLEDEFLFCETMSTRTTAAEIFNKVDKFFVKNGIKWEHAVGVCTDGAPAMLGCRSGFQTLVKGNSPNIIGTHCTIHRQALIMKTAPEEFNNVFAVVIKAVNFIKASALNSRLFSELCRENESDFETLLLHSHVRWLSKGKVLKRVFVLRDEMQQFLQNAKQDIQANFSDNRFLQSLSFLVDIFEFVNSINLGLQGKGITVLHCHEKLTAFQMKIELWYSKLEKKNFASFPQLNSFIDENDLEIDEDIIDAMKQHILMLRKEISHYFPNLEEFDKQYRFVNSPFAISIHDLPSDDNVIQEQFIDLLNDRGAKHIFAEMCCSDFWINMSHTYPDVAKMALKVIVPFATTYECETSFSALLAIKSKCRNKMDVQHDMRVALSKTIPNIQKLVEAKQIHPSH